jgi:hypothetical protein
LAFSLGANRKVPYSATEVKLFAFIPQGARRVTSTDLVEAYWKGRRKPHYWRVAAMDCLRSLKEKVIANKEPFKIKTSGRAGPKPLDVWIEKR